MTIAPLGKLRPDRHMREWLRSARIRVPYFGELELPFVLCDIESDSAPADFECALSAFLRLGSDERRMAGEYVFRLYRQFVEAVGEEQFDLPIPTASVIWDFVMPKEIHLSRRPREDRLIYVEILAECRWEVEHGLAVIYRGGSRLSRVSEQDGHLTTSDAFDLPEEQDRIIYAA